MYVVRRLRRLIVNCGNLRSKEKRKKRKKRKKKDGNEAEETALKLWEPEVQRKKKKEKRKRNKKKQVAEETAGKRAREGHKKGRKSVVCT
jgi:hypothetical protein